jgi:hypothetical protein
MPLIICPDCKREISDVAPNCPGCGRPNQPASNVWAKDLKGVLKVAAIGAFLIVVATLGFRSFHDKDAAPTGTASGIPAPAQVIPSFEPNLEGQLNRIEFDGGHSREAVVDNWEASLETVSYPALEKNPFKLAGKPYAFYGKIVQIQEGDSFTSARIRFPERSDWVLYVQGRFETPYLEGQFVNVVGYLAGSYSYESQAGWNITIPAFAARAIFSDKDRKPYDDLYKQRHGATRKDKPLSSRTN